MRIARFLVAASLVGCGVSTQEYDERTAELHRTERDLAGAVSKAEDARKELERTGLAVVQAQAAIRELQRTMEKLGIKSDKDVVTVRALIDAEREKRELASRLAAERAQLEGALREDVEAGVVRIDERDGKVRVVVPE